MKQLKGILLFFSILIAYSSFSQEEARLMRFPAIHQNQIVFSYGGDLYSVGANGGIARKITTHEGYEMFPRFSPNGDLLAFTGQYDGNTEVFIMPAAGGEPTRLTYTATLDRDKVSDRMGPNNIVMEWTPDGKNIIYRSRKESFNSFKGKLYKVSTSGGLSERLPLPEGGFCSYAPDGEKMAYNRVFREFRTWKYYRGGMADDIWIHNFDTRETTNITNHKAQDIIPMWHQDRIYFLSDRDRTMNLFVYHTGSEKIEKVTDFEKYDIKFPSKGKNHIVFEKGGYIFKLNLDNHKVSKVNIKIADDKLASRKERIDATEFIASSEIAPNGKRALFSARGDIWTVPAKSGITYNLTESSGAHDRSPKWSPNGEYIAYLSDKSGEYEIYIRKADGSEAPQQMTEGADTYKYSLQWSPDSKKILWSDKKMRLRYVNIENKQVTDVAESGVWEYRSYDWSPDSKWIAFAEPQKNDMTKVRIYNTQTQETTDITRGWYQSTRPEFGKDGKYLFFSSDRDFNPIYSRTEWNHAYKDMGKIYLVTLTKDTPSPFQPENDKVMEDNGDNNEKADQEFDIETDGIKDRIINLPVKAGVYYNLHSTGDKLFYKARVDDKTSMKYFDLKKKKEQDLEFKGGFDISHDGEKILVGKKKSYAILPLPSDKIKMKDKLDLSDMKLWVDKKTEWKQIFDESWRQMRDFFYVPNMHGVDWKAMHDKYGQMLPYVNNRHDLNYLIGEMIAELNVGHAYVNGGDLPEPERIKTGLLGAQLSRHSSGYYKIDSILEGENFRARIRSPLKEIGLDVSEGDFIIAINGESTAEMNNIYKPLVGKAKTKIEMTFNSEPSKEGAHTEIVTPISDESELHYYNWVQQNIEKVNRASDGQVGYIHVPDMGRHGLNKFAKYFYPQLTKKALIIDDRGNGGGNVSPMLIERLRREVTRAKMARNKKVPGHVPTKMMLGPKVLLIDQYSASDGDLFPYSFKKHDMGPVIGVRSWGGVVGIRGSLPFIDGADLRKPEFASYSSEESKWIIEGKGVKPDIEVHNDPAKEYQGIDQQLNKAIEIILQRLDEYKKMPPIPEGPDKTGDED
ncbi:MAG: PDZ domain-containing protein [Bacteroidales bacterium]|nr:PDZ domain-containing protein [Bacteroidales bacterium]MCF8334620.1 PDZ domain-containing protein [Bacteroidales bacterium]